MISCKTGDKVDFDKYYEVSDDTDEVSSIITVIDDSKVDFNKAGKYSVPITASDLSGNQSQSELEL